HPHPHPRIRGRAIGVFQTASSIGMALFPLTLGLARHVHAAAMNTTVVIVHSAQGKRESSSEGRG
ncbi:hypothetical protein, partial [Curtobacterium sp. MCSS17_006]|uniref:hypothetical protein n=1 Tax=Curtobacterium sp. MCSS17_006 TaxID=2175642 RepID=UPI001C64EA4E